MNPKGHVDVKKGATSIPQSPAGKSLLEEIEIEMLNEQLLRNALKAFNTNYLKDLTLSDQDNLPLGFHKGYWDAANNQMFAEAASKGLSAPLPVFGQERFDPTAADVHTDGNKPWRPKYIKYHRIGALTTALQWGMGCDEYLLFAGWSRSITSDLPFFVENVKEGNDMYTDLFYLAQYDARFATKRNRERDELIKTILYKQLECSRETDPASFSKKADNDTMAVIHLSGQSIDKMLKKLSKDLTLVCQIPFGIGGYHGLLEKVFGFDEEKVPRLHWRGNVHPMFPVFPGLYAHVCGAIIDVTDTIVTGTIDQLITLFSSSNLSREMDLYEKNLLGKMCII